MAKPHKNDISIGPDRWIAVADLRRDVGRPIEVDHLIAPMEPFWRALETNCVAECCGIDAFDLWPEQIQRAARDAADPELGSKIEALRNFVQQTKAEVFVSSKLNNLFRPEVLLELLAHIADNVRDASRET